MRIELRNLEGARILLSEHVEAGLSIVFDRLTMTDIGSMTERVYNAIKNAPNGVITRADLLQKFSHRINARELSLNTETLIKAGRIKPDTDQGKVLYRLVK